LETQQLALLWLDMAIGNHVITNLCGTVQTPGWENKDVSFSFSSESLNSFTECLLVWFFLLATKGLETEAS